MSKLLTMKYALIVILNLSFSINAFSQNDFKGKYESKTVYLQSRLFGSLKVVNSNQSIPRKEFQSEFLRFDESAYEYKQYKKSRNLGIWTFLAGVAVYTTGVLVVENDTNAGIGLMTAGFGIYFISAGNFVSSGNHLSKSVWYYNQNVLMEE